MIILGLMMFIGGCWWLATAKLKSGLFMCIGAFIAASGHIFEASNKTDLHSFLTIAFFAGSLALFIKEIHHEEVEMKLNVDIHKSRILENIIEQQNQQKNKDTPNKDVSEK